MYTQTQQKPAAGQRAMPPAAQQGDDPAVAAARSQQSQHAGQVQDSGAGAVFTLIPEEQHFAASMREVAFWEVDADEPPVSPAPADGALGRTLSTDEQAALAQAHTVGTPTPDGYSFGDLRSKATVLKDAGFTRPERRTLMEEGYAGSQYGVSEEERNEWRTLPRLLELFSQFFTEEYLRDTKLATLPVERFHEAARRYCTAFTHAAQSMCRLADSMVEREKHGLLHKRDVRNAESLMRSIMAVGQSFTRFLTAVKMANAVRVQQNIDLLVIDASQRDMLAKHDAFLKDRYYQLAEVRTRLIH